MCYRITFYCPDRHITYNIHTLDKTGVGGGVTARVRIAHALAREGHRVKMFVNCPSNELISNVSYEHFSEINHVDTDIFIATTSGGEMDLSGILNKKINARLKILFIHGEPEPIGYDDLSFDYIYSPSNFIARSVATRWGIDANHLFVTHHGIAEELFSEGKILKPVRNEFRLVYAGHPSKGLNAAIEILRSLRASDPRFSLEIFGGNQLWGQKENLTINENGVTFHGLIGQKQLAQQIQKSGFCINLQNREEPFGMVVTESMRAGCVVIASPVGAYPEIIQNGYNGFLIPGNSEETQTKEIAVQLIQKLADNHSYREYIRRNALQSPLTWQMVAKTWEDHWNWVLNHSSNRHLESSGYMSRCSICGGQLLMLADGLHCIDCGHYQRSFKDNFLRDRLESKG